MNFVIAYVCNLSSKIFVSEFVYFVFKIKIKSLEMELVCLRSRNQQRQLRKRKRSRPRHAPIRKKYKIDNLRWLLVSTLILFCVIFSGLLCLKFDGFITFCVLAGFDTPEEA